MAGAVTYPQGHWVVANHVHRFGNTQYLIRVTEGSEFTEEDFIAFLGDDFELDRDDEYVTMEQVQDGEVMAV